MFIIKLVNRMGNSKLKYSEAIFLEINYNANIKEKILEAAKELFLEQGFAKTTIRQITKKAEFKNQASFYYYFKSKEEIVTTMVSRFYHQIFDLEDEINLDQNDDILIFCFLQLIVFNKLYLIEKSRNLVIEAEEHLDLNNILNATPRYTNLTYEIIHKNHIDIPEEKIHYYINIYLAGVERTFKSIENNSLKMPLEDASNYLQTLFLELIGIEKSVISEKIAKAKLVYDSIDKQMLEKISLF